MLIAGLAAIKEIDIKKIVALSTLSQLGVIITSIGAQLFSLAYFHMLSHAFFKALLFITVGAIIHLSRDFQDLRKIRAMSSFTQSTLRFSVAANLSLCGLPFIRGFYSKDACIEIFASTGHSSLAIVIFFVATGLTAAYTARFIKLTYIPHNRRIATLWAKDKDAAINNSIFGLFPLSVVGGCMLNWAVLGGEPLVIIGFSEKFLTLAIIISGAIFGALYCNIKSLKFSFVTLMGSI